jgi:hypothetical protein
MARIRTIKPEFWANEKVMNCSRGSRLLFIGLWNFADDGGRLRDSAKTIKAQIFPGDDDVNSEIVRGMIDELSGNGLLQKYEVNGEAFLQVTGWDHQRIDKPRPSKIPPPDSTNVRRPIPPDLILSNLTVSNLTGGVESAPLARSPSGELRGAMGKQQVSSSLKRIVASKGWTA